MRTAISPMGVIDMAKDYIIDYGSNNTGWWRKWKSGFIEQGGNVFNLPPQNTHLNQTTTLNISFNTINYFVTIIGTNSNNEQSQSCGILLKKVNTFKWSSSYWWGRDSNITNLNWYACGY